MAASMAGALDLGALKAQAEAKKEAERRAAQAGPSATGLAPVVAAGDATFEAEVLDRSMQVPVVVAFYTPRDPGSMGIIRALENKAQQDGGIWVAALVDIEAAPGLVQALGVPGVPLLVAFAAGRPVAQFEGSDAQLDDWLDQLNQAIGPQLAGPPAMAAEGESAEEPEDPRFTQAAALVDSGDFAGAIALYDAILAAEPHNADARALKNNIVLLQRVTESDPELAARAESEPKNLPAQFLAADMELLAGNPPAAFDRLITVIKGVFGDERKAVQARLLSYFELFAADDEQVLAARRQLASALF